MQFSIISSEKEKFSSFNEAEAMKKLRDQIFMYIIYRKRSRTMNRMPLISDNSRDDAIVPLGQSLAITVPRFPRLILQFLARVERFDKLSNIPDMPAHLYRRHIRGTRGHLAMAGPSHCDVLVVRAPFSLPKIAGMICQVLRDRVINAWNKEKSLINQINI